jgi:RNA polymerase sigma-70 factor (ECF subfamily)
MIFNLNRKKPGKKSDEEILDEFRLYGDLELLGELYSRYLHLVYGVCLKYLKDRESSKDAVMQIFEKLITEIPKRNIENFRNWLHVVTKNHCLMQLRSEKIRDRKLTEIANNHVIFMEIDPVMHPLDDPDPGLEKKLQDCISKLKDEQKECIRQFYYGDKCYKEIAVNLKIDENKVKSHLQNAKRNLKICLEKKNGEEEKTY